MIKDKGIFIRNIYVMLSYAFQELKHNNFENIASQEDFEHVLDLLAEILYRGVSKQLKQGLFRKYVTLEDSILTVRGKIVLSKTIQNKFKQQRKIACEFDELSENNIYNQILKTTIYYLIPANELSTQRRQQLRMILPFFSSIDLLQPSSIRWKDLVFQKNNSNYRMLMNVCYFIIDGLLMTTHEGNHRMASFIEKHMPKLFEHFVLEYFRYHHKSLQANADKIPWNISNKDECHIDLLPEMKSDIVLHKEDKRLVIDTKYYSESVVQNLGKTMLHSSNMYQIFSYVKNLDVNNTGCVSGMLLYAKTEEEISPNLDAMFGKNHILVQTLDLNQDFHDIFRQLDEIAQEF